MAKFLISSIELGGRSAVRSLTAQPLRLGGIVNYGPYQRSWTLIGARPAEPDWTNPLITSFRPIGVMNPSPLERAELKSDLAGKLIKLDAALLEFVEHTLPSGRLLQSPMTATRLQIRLGSGLVGGYGYKPTPFGADARFLPLPGRKGLMVWVHWSANSGPNGLSQPALTLVGRPLWRARQDLIDFHGQALAALLLADIDQFGLAAHRLAKSAAKILA